MRTWIQCVTAPASETGPAFMLCTDQVRYLFNCPESTQRMCFERSIRLMKLSKIFFTRLSWDCVGGYPGMILTINDMGVNRLTVHGTKPGLSDLMTAVTTITNRRAAEIILEQVPINSEDLHFDDEYFNVVPVPFSTTTFIPSKRKSNDDNCTSTAVVCCYIFKGADYRGKFDPVAAKKLGLQPGPLFRELSAGNSVITPEGQTIHPNQVLGPTRKGPKVFIIDCPLEELVSSITADPRFNSEDAPSCIVHLLGKGIITNEQYLKWIKSFPESTKHLISSEDYPSSKVQFYKSAENQAKLSLLDLETFPLPLGYSDSKDPSLDEKLLGKNVRLMQPGLSFFLESGKFEQDGSYLPLAKLVETSLAELGQKDLQQIAEVKASLAKDGKKVVYFSNDPILYTLGTGSAVPSRRRNVSGNLLVVPGYGSIILDAGEGTFGQLLRLFETKEQFLEPLRCIYISHIHADHHLGLVNLVLHWKRYAEVLKEERVLYIVGPTYLWNWLTCYNRVEDIGIDKLRFINCSELDIYRTIEPDNTTVEAEEMKKKKKEEEENKSGLLKALGLNTIATTKVIHCPLAFGVMLAHKCGWKFVYSGDTRPCERLVQLGMNATLLLHEATLEDKMIEEAKEKAHSTTKEAIDIGQSMNAQYTLLTHFSQRYSSIPKLENLSSPTSSTSTSSTSTSSTSTSSTSTLKPSGKTIVGIAFDFMKIKFSDLWKLPLYIPAFKVLFKEEEEVMVVGEGGEEGGGGGGGGGGVKQ